MFNSPAPHQSISEHTLKLMTHTVCTRDYSLKQLCLLQRLVIKPLLSVGTVSSHISANDAQHRMLLPEAKRIIIMRMQILLKCFNPFYLSPLQHPSLPSPSRYTLTKATDPILEYHDCTSAPLHGSFRPSRRGPSGWTISSCRVLLWLWFHAMVGELISKWEWLPLNVKTKVSSLPLFCPFWEFKCLINVFVLLEFKGSQLDAYRP